MKLTVSTHKLSGHRSTLRTAKTITDKAVRLVDRQVRGTMPDVDVVLANERGMVDLMVAADLALAGADDRRSLRRATSNARQVARDILAVALPRPDGSALIVIQADKHTTPGAFAVTVVHELVHAVQFSRRDVTEHYVRQRRHELGLQRQNSRQARQYERLLREHEGEAYSHEYLADHIVPGATATRAA